MEGSSDDKQEDSSKTPESVRVSRRLQIKRDTKAVKRKLVKINLKSREETNVEDIEEEDDSDSDDIMEIPAEVDKNDRDYGEGPSTEKRPVGRPRKKQKVSAKDDESSGDILIQEAFSLNENPNNPNRKRKKVFDYESALNELREMQEKQKVEETRPSPKVITIDLPSPITSPRFARPSILTHKRSTDVVAQTEHTGPVSGSGSHYAILKNNVDLKWANDKLLKENAALKARVNILLDMLVQKTSQLKLLKMACVDGKQKVLKS